MSQLVDKHRLTTYPEYGLTLFFMLGIQCHSLFPKAIICCTLLDIVSTARSPENLTPRKVGLQHRFHQQRCDFICCYQKTSIKISPLWIALGFKLNPREKTFPCFLLADLEWFQTYASVVYGICYLRTEKAVLSMTDKARLGSPWFISLLIMSHWISW